MVFRICNTRCLSARSVIDYYPILSKYGYHGEHKYRWCGTAGLIVINSLEELRTFQKDVNHEIIIDMTGDIPSIEIYDDYRE